MSFFNLLFIVFLGILVFILYFHISNYILDYLAKRNNGNYNYENSIRPIIFIAPPDPNKNRQYSKVIENSDIHRVMTFESLLSIIEYELSNINESKETAVLKNLIFNNLSINKILDNSFEAIRNLI